MGIDARAGLVSPGVRHWARRRFRHIARDESKKRGSSQVRGQERRRRLLLVHLDGVPIQVLRAAIDDGTMPFLGRLVRSGAYRLDSAFWGSPASTPAFQAGMLYGLRHPNLPAYHWYDRELGRTVHMNVPRDTVAIEERLASSHPESLLSGGGRSYLSLFRAGAENQAAMTALANLRELSRTVRRELPGLGGPARQGLWAWAQAVAKDTWSTVLDVRDWGRGLGGDFRHEREYLINRLLMMSMAWNVAHSRALIDLVRGVPVVYLVFGNYDEVAHRRGPLSHQALAQLARVDRELEELYAFSRLSSPAYDVIFVTDHGHVESVPFEQRQPLSLPETLCRDGQMVLDPSLEAALLDGRGRPAPVAGSHLHVPEVVEAGNFAHVYLERGPEPLEAAALLSGSHREVLARIACHPDIGIAALRRGEQAVALIGGRVYGPGELASAPLDAEYNRHALADLLHELPHMKTAGDVVIYGQAAGPARTVGFAWEFGSHGGLTHAEVDSAILWPLDGAVRGEDLTHVVQLHERLAGAYLDTPRVIRRGRELLG